MRSVAAMSSFLMCSRNSKQKADDGDEEQEQMVTRGGGGTAAPGTMRKGPWTEEEDAQLVRFVRLFGERRWDFLAKVSGLRRTGKSCRLRWVNYLHPGLRRGRITADEERLIVELHGKWGSRWSRIARSLPGRTDNEIKNFWRTRARKMALDERRRGGGGGGAKTAGSSSPSSSLASSECPGSPNSGAATSSSSDSSLREEGSSGDDDEAELELEEASTTTTTAASLNQHQQPQEEYCYATAMDQLWNEIAAADAAASFVIDSWGSCCPAAEPPSMPPPSPVWDYCSDDYSLWKIDDDEYYKKMLDAS